jgi:autotransporter-associated beta strand protein
VSSGGSNFNLTIIGTAYREWANVAFDANFGNINVMTTNGGSIGIKGNTTLGNPTNALAVFSNATVTLYADTTNVTVNKNMMLYGGSTNQNGTGTNGILSPITLGVASGDVCTFNVAGTSLSVSNVISGPGTLVKIGSSPLYLFATNTYTGSTVVTGGPLSLTNNGSISASTNISVASSQVLDVSGRSDKTLNLVSGQTLQGSGTISGNLTAVSGSIVMPGIAGTGTLTVTNTVNLGGTTALSVGATVTNVLSGAIINYGGTLQLSLVGSFAAGNSFKLFNSTKTNYSGNFTSISPATPGAGLEWNTSLLNVNGTLAVRLVPQPATFSSWIVSGSSLTFSGTGGASNGPYQVFTSTNIGLPVTNWTQVGSGNFSGTGNFSFTTTNTNNASQFYILKEQ